MDKFDDAKENSIQGDGPSICNPLIVFIMGALQWSIFKNDVNDRIENE